MDAFNFSLSAAVQAVKGSRKKDKKRGRSCFKALKHDRPLWFISSSRDISQSVFANFF
jgi:hypothetical protein